MASSTPYRRSGGSHVDSSNAAATGSSNLAGPALPVAAVKEAVTPNTAMTPTSTTASAAATTTGSSAMTAAYLVAPTPHAASIDANSRRIALELAGSVMAMVAAGDWDDGVVGTVIEAAEDAPAGLFCTGYCGKPTTRPCTTS